MGWGKNRTRGEAAKLLHEYENLNSDLPRRTRRHLGFFVIGPKVGVDALENLTNRALGPTVFRHRSWMWWNIFRFSGVGQEWEWFCRRRNEGESRDQLLYELRGKVSRETWEKLSKRAGVPVKYNRKRLYPSKYKEDRTRERKNIWTKGGSWDKRNSFTKIIVLGESISPRDPITAWERRLGVDGCKRIERELYGMIDPDETLYPDAIYRSIDYVRRRIPEILGYDRGPASAHTAAWFFQRRVPDENDFFFDPDPDTAMKGTDVDGRHSWRWFPEKED